MRALRLDKTILAALSATLDLYLGPDPTQSVPILQLISTPLEELQTRAESPLSPFQKYRTILRLPWKT